MEYIYFSISSGLVPVSCYLKRPQPQHRQEYRQTETQLLLQSSETALMKISKSNIF
jgi:hypothetical protein